MIIRLHEHVICPGYWFSQAIFINDCASRDERLQGRVGGLAFIDDPGPPTPHLQGLDARPCMSIGIGKSMGDLHVNG